MQMFEKMLKENPDSALEGLHFAAMDEPSGKSIAFLLKYKAPRTEQFHALINRYEPIIHVVLW
jgi:hypothetical protein